MRNSPAFPILALALGVAASASPGQAQPAIHLPGEERPPVLERIGAPEGLTALTIAASGERAAAALARAEESGRSTVLLYSTDSAEPSSLELEGLVRDLLFAPDSRAVLGLLHRPAKKREGDTHLLRIELDPPRARRLMRLPPSSRSLDFWPARNSLLVASRNEIRTLTLPDLRSGPLFRVIGENLSVASLGEGLVLVGQPDALLLIDLDAPPGDTQMPVLERVEALQAVLSLAAASDGSRALAQLADGSVHAVELRPLRLAATGLPGSTAATGKHVPPAPPASTEAEKISAGTTPPASVAGPEAEAPTAPPEAPSGETPEEREPAVEPETAAAEEIPAGATPPASVSGPEAEAPTAPPEAPSGETPEEREPAAEPGTAATEEIPTAAEPGGTDSSAAPRRVPPAPPAGPPREPLRPVAHQVRGRIGGPAAAHVVAVVFLGPDNLLREALRVVPGADGGWSADGLEPGRYRVQLDGGGQRVIVSRPPFLLLELRSGESVDAGEIQALRTL